MTAYPIPNPFANFVGATGLPLTGAKIYIGVAGGDPETSPIAVFQDAALSIPFTQPLRTSGGYLVGTGTPANAYPSVSPYSIKVCTSANVEVFYLASAHSEIADLLALLAASTGAGLVGLSQSATYAQGTMGLHGQATRSAKDAPYNAKGDGTTNDTTALQAGFNAASAVSGALVLPAGRYKTSGTITASTAMALTGEAGPITPYPPVLLQYYGTGGAMVAMPDTSNIIANIGLDNKGTAQDGITFTGGAHQTITRGSFLLRSGCTAFTRSVIYSNSSAFGYTVIRSCTAGGGIAPNFIYSDTGSTGTTNAVLIDCREFESATGAPLTVSRVKDNGDSWYHIRCSLNGQGGGASTWFDSRDTIPDYRARYAIGNYVLSQFEYDRDGVYPASSTDRAAYIHQVGIARIEDGSIQGGGLYSFADVRNGIVDLRGNTLFSLAAHAINLTDTTSTVIVGPNSWAQNTNGVYNSQVAIPAASFTATTANNDFTLVVTAVASGEILDGATIAGAGIPTGTMIVQQIDGTPNGVGTYYMNQKAAASASVAVTIASATTTTAAGIYKVIPIKLSGSWYFTIDLQMYDNGVHTQLMEVTDNSPIIIKVLTMQNGPPFRRAGRRRGGGGHVLMRNVSGGALGAITTEETWKIADLGGAFWPTPADGFSSSLRFEMDVLSNGTEYFRQKDGAWSSTIPN